MHILLATEDKNLRLAIHLVLSEEPGLNVVGTVSDMSSMLALYRTACPDVVLMDWKLIGMTAEGALKDMKSCDDPASVIVLGGDSTEGELALKAGADRFVIKGSPPRELINAIHSV